MVIQFGAAESRLLRLLRLAGGGSWTEQFHLSPIGIEPRLDSVPGIVDLGTNPLQLVAKPQLVANTRRERTDKPREPAPKLAGADISSRQDLVADKVAQDFRNADFADRKPSCSCHHVAG